jgi:hypothetical protein
MRILLAGLLGAIAMFAWNFVAHMLLPLGHLGISEIPNEAAVLSALQTNIGNQAGLYIFPGTGLGPDASKEETKKAMERLAGEYETKATGVLVYRPPGDRSMAFGKWLAREFILEVVEALLAAFLLAQAGLASCAKRVMFVTIIGIVAAITTNMSASPARGAAAELFHPREGRAHVDDVSGVEAQARRRQGRLPCPSDRDG